MWTVDSKSYMLSTNLKEVSECLKCGCNTYTHALKTKYNKRDMSEDFPIDYRQSQIIVFECGEKGCNEQYYPDKSKLYEMIFYENTDYKEMVPEEPDYDSYMTIVDWHCPKHPNSKLYWGMMDYNGDE